ncbi:hypothetical protein J7T55_004877 [Diaporthe amygdali]|uniref:uncharacterized protein n=1 Tax=Phomopsis amygdali TaxID=1214568 RepID=UPI0022FEBBD4|nr:uncharacterized protein J7T55_004877 [Diaporthe amygdali]KAJ0114633.1 hypothetical protein J7T55_004877 [Diaporthe amygdali]
MVFPIGLTPAACFYGFEMLKFALLLIYATVEAAYIPVDFFRYPWVSVYHIDSYDDVVSKGLVNFTALGHYGDVDYTGLAVAKASELSQTLGIVPQSMPNTVYYGGVNGLLSSTEVKISTPIRGPTDMGSYDRLFKPHSFWFGCLTLSAKPGSCNVTVTSYQYEQAAQTQVFRFEASATALSVNMTKAVFSDDFTFVHGLIFTTSFDTVGVLGATVLDNFEYTYNTYLIG